MEGGPAAGRRDPGRVRRAYRDNHAPGGFTTRPTQPQLTFADRPRRATRAPRATTTVLADEAEGADEALELFRGAGELLRGGGDLLGGGAGLLRRGGHLLGGGR